MDRQNYEHHARYVPAFHFVTLAAILALFVGSLINLFHSGRHHLFAHALICLIAVILGLLFAFIRIFPLKVQDRTIRAEENLRHYVLTGKLLDSKLTMSQVIALRFASDEEFVVLATRAHEENMTAHEIKRQIRHWRPDHHRA